MNSLNTNTHRNFAFLMIVGIMLASDPALASKLEAAAQSAQSTVLTIAQITAVCGIAIGGILMGIGMTNAGKMTLGGGVVGAVASIGGPAFISTLQDIFGK